MVVINEDGDPQELPAPPASPTIQMPVQTITASPPQEITAPPPAPVYNLARPPQLTRPAIAPPVVPADHPAFPGGSKPGSIRATPQQAQSETLGQFGKAKEIEAQEAAAKQEKADAEAKVRADAAAEADKFKQDYAGMLKANAEKYDANHKQTQEAYAKYRAEAGHLKDPTNQFWDEHGGFAGGIAAAFAAGLSGFGASLSGHGGNPFLDYLNKRMDANFEAHKQNIKDLYESAVESGRIEDTAENHNRFMADAKLQSRILDTEHTKAELDNIAANSTSKIVPIAAARAQNALDQEITQQKARFAQQEAQAAAAGMAQQRAQHKEIREAFLKAVEKHNADLGPDESRIAAFQDVAALYPRSAVAQLADGLGIGYDVKTGKFVPPAAEEAPTSTSNATGLSIDKSGKLVIPTKDPVTGKSLKPAERDKLAASPEAKTLLQNHADINELDDFSKHTNVLSSLEIDASKRAYQDAYRAKVYSIVARKYKIDTSANEPRNVELIEKLAAPYLPRITGEDPQVTQERIDRLKHDIAVDTAGVTGEQVSPSAETPPEKTGKQPEVPIKPLAAPTPEQAKNLVAEQTVPMQKDGVLVKVPLSRVEEAKQKGYVLPAH